MPRSIRSIPLTLKWLYAIFILILIPLYWINYGPTNFLWISDISLILGFLAVMTENRLLASMAAIEGFVLESFWTVCYFLALLFNVHFTEIADYMFDTSLPFWLRGLSLFHVALPPLFFFLLRRLGYDKRAYPIQTIFTAFLLLTTWLITEPAKNINWVYTYIKLGPLAAHPWLYLALESFVVSVIFSLTHLVICKFASKRKRAKYELPDFEV